MELITINLISEDCYFYDQIQLQYKQLKFVNKPVKVNPKKRLKLDAAFAHYFLKELSISDFFRNSFIDFFQRWDILPKFIVLKTTNSNLIDYRWNERVYFLVRERCELDHALSWLSTLGGAFSALGDYFQGCAETAGKISVHQLQLAVRLGDPTIASRCRLYLSLSLIQKKKFKVAVKVIRTEYLAAKNQVIIDQRLIRMCQGIWSKLQYEHELYRIRNKIKR
ncbi:hypothetical protein GWI33_019303 [Rhynchophorus ferrugineus]|uniref:Uncharacterized protein n=1 Tax=Rhynchophorus ferrugineus TaxID=354439 RepID=A0A834HRZ0_RHYFE|nr:hypothetical protein GWI33_019303 [Rhynchophorus ferrugineus]